MPITSSGEIALIADIEAEFDQAGVDNISLATARDDAGLPSGEVAISDFYGLSDVVTATVSTSTATSITHNSMLLNGNLTNLGGGTVSSHGFYFGTSSTYTSNTKYNLGAKGSTGTFTNARTGLNASTNYYYTAFAINEAGEAVGTTLNLSTSAPPFTATVATLGTSSRVASAYSSPSQAHNIRQYHKNGYSGSIYTTLRYNTNITDIPQYATQKYLYQIGTAQTQAVTNADQMIIFWKSGPIEWYRGISIILYAASGRSFSSISQHSPYGNTYATGAQYATASLLSCTRAQDGSASSTLSSAAIQFRYS
jgi:hypothetical protein